LREGDWKLIGQVTLPSRVELFNVVRDPAEKKNLAASHAEQASAMQRRIAGMAEGAVPPLLLRSVMGVSKRVRFGGTARGRGRRGF
jgi:hypothetical protein